MIASILLGHTSPETALLVPDYPYGRKIRCRIKYWREYDAKKGFRFCSQTENPKTLVWNNPKRSTYCKVAMQMFLDERNYVQHSALSEYDDEDRVLAFIQSFPQMDQDNRLSLLMWCKMKSRLHEELAKGTAYFTMNNVKQEASEVEVEEHKKEKEVWDECLRLMA